MTKLTQLYILIKHEGYIQTLKAIEKKKIEQREKNDMRFVFFCPVSAYFIEEVRRSCINALRACFFLLYNCLRIDRYI